MNSKTTAIIENSLGKAMLYTEGDRFGPLPTNPNTAALIVRSQLERHAKLGNCVVVTIRQVSKSTFDVLEKDSEGRQPSTNS